MLLLAFCLLIASAFAVNPYPLEYANNGAQIGPNTNLVFNYEHIRSDQPPHIEMREENINKYRNRPRPVTTPVPRRYPGDESYVRPKNPLPYSADQWEQLQKAPKYDGPKQNWKSVPAPPNFPHWETLAQSNPNNYEYMAQQSLVPSEEPAQYSGDIYNPAQYNYDSTSYETTQAPMYPPSNPPMPSMQAPPRHVIRSPAGRRRGNQRSYNERVNMEPSTTPAAVPAPMPAQSRMPPPAVPTLSPWHDGF